MRKDELSLLDTIKEGIPVPCKEGYPFIAIALGITLFFYIVDWDVIGHLMLVVTVWVYYFFRDPVRVTPEGDDLIISPADGVVQMITEVVPPAELEMGAEPLTRISVFLNIFNVHINRVPAAGTITRLYYHPGKFLNASMEKASEENERQLAKVTCLNGKEVGFLQIAGLIARRIKCTLHEGQGVISGERFGLIRFGSRMDIFLPKDVAPLVCVGQTAIAGETVLADMSDTKTTARTGTSH
ncbi:MAG: phosphatidylserine decarboxylase [Alphaproteobacteria bacterium]|nr:phosphatidylserine decarboxylase [Alphaproteobacteria bacterium]